jgi:gamma-glutamylcyclotransferase (GGCT)/AIG2-like uncharacterized protein YtfP
MSKKHYVYVYGTLRPGNSPVTWIPGKIYDLGYFPAAKLLFDDEKEGSAHNIACEKLEVDEEGLKRLDRLEGYVPSDPSQSLYNRVKFRDGWIYEYNYDVPIDRRINCGDWLIHRRMTKGANSDFFRFPAAKLSDEDKKAVSGELGGVSDCLELVAEG